MPGTTYIAGKPTTWRETARRPYFLLTDLILIAILAALGLATKQVIYPLVSLATMPFYLPTGAIAGGIYMMWLIVARGVVAKPGAALAVALVQGFVAFLTPFGKHGIYTFIIYLAPGIMVELVMLAGRHNACCLGCTTMAGIMANMVGSALVSSIILAAPVSLVLFTAAVGGIAGAIGGPIALALLRSYWKVFPKQQPATRGAKTGTGQEW